MCVPKELGEDNPFIDPDVRREFTCKVFLVLTLQLSATIPMIILAVEVEEVHDYVVQNFWLAYLGAGLVMMVNIVLIYCGFMLRRCPSVGIMAALMTTGMTLMAMVAVCSTYSVYVYQALASTAGIFLVLCLLAVTIPVDMSVYWFIPVVIALVAMIAALVAHFVPTKTSHLVFFSLALTGSVISMLISLQQILEGNHVRFYYYPEDYAIAAIFLYVDLICILLNVLGIFAIEDE